jgi:hypothetical protein
MKLGVSQIVGETETGGLEEPAIGIAAVLMIEVMAGVRRRRRWNGREKPR